MEKKKKKQLIALIAIVVALVATLAILFFAGGYKIKFEEVFATDLAYEYGQEADIPKAYVVNKFGIRQMVKVEYEFTSADGVVTKTNYPVAKCDSVGEWKVTCTYKTAKVTKEFQVVDTVAPEILIGALPSDVYVGNTEVEYTVPGVDFKDSSPIDYNNSSVSLYFEGEQVEYNTLTNAFIPEKDGEYVFKVKAVDIYGNTSEAECNWRAKDPNWTDSELPDKYLATFDTVGYANLISSGFINQYWSGTEVEEFLEEYEGEKGVLKVTAKYNEVGLTAFKVKLAKFITPKQLGDNVIIIRYRVDDEGTDGKLTLAGNYQESIQSAAAKYFEYTPGEWQTATITAEDLTKYAYADNDGILRTLQFGFGRSGSGASLDVYLASITIGEKLEAPQNLRAFGGNIKWDAVKGAAGYYLFVDGEEVDLDASVTSYQLGKNKIFKIRAKGDGLFSVDSDESIYVNDTLAKGYLAEFDEEYYKYLVWNNGARAEGGMEWYESDSFEATYDAKEEAVRLDLTQGYVTAGVVVRLPKATKTADLDSVVIRFKADENVKCVRIYQYGGPGLLLETTEIKEGWNSLVIPKKMLLGDADDTSMFSGYQMMFFANKEPVNGKGQGTKMTVYLGEVTKATQLETPTGLKLSGSKLSWETVANAKGYVVDEDGKEKKVSGTSYTINGGELFKVRAVGDGRFYVDSEEAIYVNGNVPAGYLAAFDKAYYEHLVWNNGASAPGGMQWYESGSFKATYDKNADALKVDMTYGYVGAGSVVRFPASVKVSELNDVVVRMKLDDTVKQVAIYQYGGVGRMYSTTDVKAGWNSIVIPHNSLLADGGSEDTMSGMQIILYTNADGQMGVKQGTATTMYLDAITNATKLSEPQNIKLDGTKLTWDKVEGASGYEVIEDGKVTKVTTNSYGSNGGNLFKVAALGDDLLSVTSGYAVYVNATVEEGYIATFDKEFYEYLIWNDGANAEGGMQWYESDSHDVTYEASTGTVRVDMTMGYVCAGSVVKFPKAVKISEIDDILVRVKLDDAVKAVAFYQYGGVGQMYKTTAVAPGWNEIVIPKAQLLADDGSEDSMSGMQIILYGNAEGENGVNQGTKTTMYLGSISSIKKLEAPKNVKVSGNTLTWDAVDGAKTYAIYEDEVRYTASTTSHTLHDGEVIKVQALGDGKTTSDSELTLYINGKVSAGYLAEFNKPYYNYLIWNNGANVPGGMQWYDSATFDAVYDATEKEMDVTAQYGFVCVGMVVKFPQGKALEGGKDFVVNIKVDDTVKSLKLFPYGGDGTIYATNDLQVGWNKLVIPAADVAAAVTGSTFDGLQIALYDNADYAFTTNSPAKTASISLGKIHYASSLDKAVLAVEGSTVSWDAVKNADSYDVYVNDEWKGNQTTTSYSVAGLGNGVYSIKVVAKSDKEIYLPSTSDAVKYSNLKILKAPVMSYSDGVVSFETVEGCAGYKIEIDGVEYDVDKDATSVKPAELIGKSILVKYRMKTIGDNVTTAASDWSDYQIQDLSLEQDYIADFDEGYTKLVWNNGKDSEAGMEWYECDSFQTAYDATEEGIKLTMKHGYVCAGFVVKFPSPVKPSDINNMVIRIKLDENIKMVRIYEYGGPGKMLEFTGLQAGWNELIIPQSNLLVDPGKDVVSGLQIIMHTSNAPAMGDSQGKDITAVLGSVKNLKITEEQDEVIFDRTDGGAYDNANTIYLSNTTVYGKIPSASAGLTVVPYGEGSGIYVDGTIDNGAVLATAASWNGVFYVRPSVNATTGTKITLKGVFVSPDGSYRFAVKEVTYQYDGSKWSVYVESEYTDITITGIDSNTNATAIYLNLSASTEAGTWASFASDSSSDAEGILYNGIKLNVNAQTTWVQNMFCIQPGKTPVAGDLLTIKGIFECGSIALNVEEYVLKYDGSAWGVYDGSVEQGPNYTPINITSVDGNTSATAIYLNLSASTEAGTWASFASDSSSDAEGILYNGTKLNVNAQTTWVQNMFCIQPGKTPAKGDTLTIVGNFKCGDIKFYIVSYTLTYNGSNWVAQ